MSHLPALQHLGVYFMTISVDSAVVVANFLQRSRCILDIFIDGFFDVMFAAVPSLRRPNLTADIDKAGSWALRRPADALAHLILTVRSRTIEIRT
jgi:hypothetical protein